MGQIVKARTGLLRDVVVGFSMLFLGILIVAKLERDNRQILTGRFVAIDGDTLVLDGARLRLEGIDAPEIGQRCDTNDRAVACGDAARRRLALWAGKGEFSCAGSERDRYDRLLVRCNAGDVDVNAAMVREGYAVSYGDYGAAEAAAKRDGLGLWAGYFQRPEDWRREHQLSHTPETGEAEPEAGFWAFIRRWLGVN